jgi:hypothetical protein
VKTILKGRVGVALVMMLALGSFGFGQGKSTAKAALAGHYEGTAKNRVDEVITVNFDLAEKDGAVTGMIRSSHGDFTITGGSHKGDDVTLEFDAGGPVGTISLKMAEDKLSGNWSVGDDGGPVEVKRAAAQQEAPKEKS